MVKRRGFILVECMISLLIFSSILLVLVISSQGLQQVKRHQKNDVQQMLVNQFVKRLEIDAVHYRVMAISDDALTIFNTKTNTHYELGIRRGCLCLHRYNGKFMSYLRDVKYAGFKKIAPHWYQITLKFTNDAVFKEEVYINEYTT